MFLNCYYRNIFQEMKSSKYVLGNIAFGVFRSTHQKLVINNCYELNTELSDESKFPLFYKQLLRYF